MYKLATTRLIKGFFEKGLTIAFAESMTCGMVTHQLNTVKNTSDVLMGSVICYHENVKTGLLNVKKSLIEKHTAESAQVTEALVKGLKKVINADVHAAITGLATDAPDKEKRKGTVYFCYSYRGKIYSHHHRFTGNPTEIKKKATTLFYELICKKVLD